MAQIMRPSTDTTRLGWTGEDGDTTSIFEHIDEAAVNDADYIRTSLSPNLEVYVTKLTPATDPEVASGHILRIRGGKSAVDGDIIDVTYSLHQGYVSEISQGTIISVRSFGNVGASFNTEIHELPAFASDAITDYTDLYVRIAADKR